MGRQLSGMSVGERLRRARLDAGKTLDQVAAETKIQFWILEAIERDDFSRVPGGVFIRGYLTAVARAVGVHPSEVLTAYSPETVPPPVAPPPPPSPPPDPNEGSGTPLWQYVVIVAMVLVAAVVWRNMTRSNPDIAAAPTLRPPVSAPPTTLPQPAPPPASANQATESGATATSGATSPTAPAEPHDADAAKTTNAPLVVQLHANDEVWIEADADGERKVYQLVEPGQDLRLEGQKEIRLLVGDAAAVSYTINGKPGRPLGGTGVVRQVVVSPANVESLTEPAQGTAG
jgi:cytoskeleton protein RodZ